MSKVQEKVETWSPLDFYISEVLRLLLRSKTFFVVCLFLCDEYWDWGMRRVPGSHSFRSFAFRCFPHASLTRIDYPGRWKKVDRMEPYSVDPLSPLHSSCNNKRSFEKMEKYMRILLVFLCSIKRESIRKGK